MKNYDDSTRMAGGLNEWKVFSVNAKLINHLKGMENHESDVKMANRANDKVVITRQSMTPLPDVSLNSFDLH